MKALELEHDEAMVVANLLERVLDTLVQRTEFDQTGELVLVLRNHEVGMLRSAMEKLR